MLQKLENNNTSGYEAISQRLKNSEQTLSRGWKGSKEIIKCWRMLCGNKKLGDTFAYYNIEDGK